MVKEIKVRMKLSAWVFMGISFITLTACRAPTSSDTFDKLCAQYHSNQQSSNAYHSVKISNAVEGDLRENLRPLDYVKCLAAYRDQQAQYELAMRYFHGIGLKKNLFKARQMFEAASMKLPITNMSVIGETDLIAASVNHADDAQIVEGSPYAMRQFAMMLEKGLGGEKNLSLAKKWLERSELILTTYQDQDKQINQSKPLTCNTSDVSSEWKVVKIGRYNIELSAEVEKINLEGNGRDYTNQHFAMLLIAMQSSERAETFRNSVAGVMDRFRRGIISRNPKEDFGSFKAYGKRLTPYFPLSYISEKFDIACHGQVRGPIADFWPNPSLRCRGFWGGKNIFFRIPSNSNDRIPLFIEKAQAVFNKIKCK